MQKNSMKTSRARTAQRSLDERKREFLEYEQRLANRVPEYHAQLSSRAYPLDSWTAATLADILENYVLSWSVMDDEPLHQWLDLTLWETRDAIPIGSYSPQRPDEFREAFANASDYEDFVARRDFT